MKQLFLLVVKYIRRQKFRTTLTFLCILFAVFVFNLLCDAFVIARGVGIADLTEYGGEAEADLVTLLDKTDDKEAAVNRLRENPAIEKYFRNGPNEEMRSIKAKNMEKEFGANKKAGEDFLAKNAKAEAAMA